MEALLWAFLGGWVARYFASRRDQGPETGHRAVTTRPSGVGERIADT
jgi:hypothetical protein